MVLSQAGVLTRGLHYLLVDSKRQSEANRIHTFQQHYGSSPLLLATVWHDITVTTILEARIPDNKLCERGFRMFLIAHFFLWTYPKNAGLLASRFQICSSHAQGEPFWTWIRKIAALKALKIVWDPCLNNMDPEFVVVTIDGTDFRTWERKHPTLNQDRKQCLKKFNHAAVKYEIAISMYTSKVVWINGPFRGGIHNLTMFRKGDLLHLIAERQKAITDRGYQSGRSEERAKLGLLPPSCSLSFVVC
jgi:hypothetical protein